MSFIDAANTALFGNEADGWWDTKGPFKVLHQMNPVRVSFVEKEMQKVFGANPFEGRRVLDIGTGGGLMAEACAKKGAFVTALDAEARNIDAARAHADTQGLILDYQVGDLSALDKTGRFDLVMALEVVEHVNSPDAFVAACASFVAPGGLLIMSTLNRTVSSYVFGILAAEYVLGWAPKGAHTWSQFVKPSELARAVREVGFSIGTLQGISFRPVTGQWGLSHDTQMNYILSARRP
ncbi:MAG: bifunctional 2-polyprenyl-6-hydroxyphenol methylase/3-demethylubiquinol 3-O-methyltransferase UbiG [Alphaproteobacteria bacterium]|nr:bifunctional 2-polyprenyl-6-hydroxyphenol methylase/3-demethylubiquinol 3-O-methyltransferase UbiG [Alphaproteobacteria bacterium]